MRPPTPSKPRSFAWLAALLLTACCACRDQGAANEPPRGIALVVSGDTAGWIVPCGCSSGQAGGLARRGTFVEDQRKKSDVIVADVGGAPAGASPYDQEKALAIFRGEVAMGLAAHNIGGSEAALGAEVLRRLSSDSNCPLVSANVRDASGSPIAPPLRLARTGGLRVALIGVMSAKFATGDLKVEDPRESILKTLADSASQYDVAVVLAYVPLDELELLARALPEVDVVVGGPTTQSVEPRRVGPVLMAAVTNKGKYLASFERPAGANSAWQGKIVEMDERIADDPAQMANLRRFRETLGQRDFSAGEASFSPRLTASLPATYQVAGSRTCRKCHANDCVAWEQSAHATAWQTLERQSATVDPYCQQCHTNGYGLPGGFQSLASAAELRGVGCESCHGPSLAHVERSATKTGFVARDQCQRCHDRENSPAFAYEPFWQAIRHGERSPGQPSSGG